MLMLYNLNHLLLFAMHFKSNKRPKNVLLFVYELHLCIGAAILDFLIACSPFMFQTKKRAKMFVFLKFIAYRIKGYKLYIISIHTLDNIKYGQIIVEVNDLRDNLPLAVENV